MGSRILPHRAAGDTVSSGGIRGFDLEAVLQADLIKATHGK